MRSITIADVINSAPLRKDERARDSHGKPMSKSDLAKLPKDISLDRLVAACKRRGVDVHDVLARAMGPEGLQEGSGINERWQAEMSWKVIDKAEPSAVKHSGDSEDPVVIVYSADDQRL